MILKRFFQRVRARSSSCKNRQTCLCTTSKRDSLYDDNTIISFNKTNEQNNLSRTDKPRRSMRQANLEESDLDDDISITDKLRCASSESPANIPMLVVVSFNPDKKGLEKNQIEIQRGFPVNAQYIVNEWLYIKTADNDEGFVPYLCCRPMLRRQSFKYSNRINSSYKPYDFDLNQHNHMGFSSTSIPTLSANKKLSSSINLRSPSCFIQNSSSCTGDSGVSDCETSSTNHFNIDPLTKRTINVSNIRSLRSSSNSRKQTGLIVQDLPAFKIHPMKSQLSVSTNSAFTQFIKNESSQKNHQNRINNQPYHYKSDILSSLSSSSLPFKSTIRRFYDDYADKTSVSYPKSNYSLSNKNNYMNDIISSPYIRRTPFVRRSLPHHVQSEYRKSSSSTNPFRTIREQQIKPIILTQPLITSTSSSTIVSLKPKLEQNFSDLNLEQIENDSFSPATTIFITQNQPVSSSSSSSTSTTDSSNDDTINCLNSLKRNNYQSARLSHSCTNNSNNPTTSFIHNVSITV